MKRKISTSKKKSHFGCKSKSIRFLITAFFCCTFFYVSANSGHLKTKEYPDLEKNATIFSTPHFIQQTWLYFQYKLQNKLKKAGVLPDNAPAMSTAWQITVNRTDPSPQPSGFQMTFRMQLQVSAVNENISYNSEVRFPAQAPTYFTLPTAHPAIESFSLDTQTNEWVVDLQDVIFAGTSIEFDLLARSPNHTTPDGTTFQIDATVTSDNAAPASDSDSGAWSAAANLGVEKYLQFGPDTDALLDIPVRYYLYPCDPAFDPNAFGHLYLSNWTLIDELPTDVVYNNSSGTYDGGSHTVTWSDTTFIKNEDCDFMGATDYWVEVTFPSTIFGEDAVPPVLEAQNIVTFEGYPTGEEVIPANQLFDSDTLLHGFGLPNPIGDHTKTANTPYFSLQDVTFEGDEAWFFINIRTSSASTTPYYFKIIDPLPCLDYTPNAATQYESQDVHDPACVNPAYQPTNFIELRLYQEYLTIVDEDDFVNANPTLPLRYLDTNGNMDTLHVPHISTNTSYITYQIEWADVQAALGSGVGLSNLIWDSEDFDVQVGLTANNLRTAARIYLSGTVAEDTPTYPMLDQYRVRNYAYFYVEAGGQEDSLGFIQDDVIISDTFPIIRPQKTVSESSGLISLTADSEGSPFADNDTLIMTDLLPFGYTFKNESQQYISLGGTGSWSWLSSSGDNNGTPYSELDNYSVRNFIDVEVIDNYNNTGRQLVRAAFLPPPTPLVWEDLSQFRFSYYVNESPMAYSAVNQMEVFPTNPTTITNLQCQTGLSHAASAAASSDPNDLDGDGITVGEAYCLDTDNVTPSSTIVNIQSYKAVRGDAIVNAPFEPFPAVGDITSSGGTADFQLNLKNIGGIDLEDLVIYDVLPHIGDTGLSETQVGNARGSDFDATFAGIDMATLPTGTIVEYSTSVNACRDELTTGATPFPTGCVNDWTTTVPSPLSSVKSLRFTFPTGDISTFAPGEAISIEYAVTYPASTQPGEVAWNNFAFAATRADDSSSILPTEPPKVGITIPQVDLSVNKSASPTIISVGEAVTYVLTINHDGAVTEDGTYTLPVSTARNIQLTDNFKSLGLVLVPNSVVIIHDESGLENGVTFDTLTGNIFIPEMGPEDSYTISYEAYSTIEQSANNSLEIISVGNADDIDSTPNNGDLGEDDMDDATVTWVQPAISIRKLIEDQAGSGNYIEADASDGLSGLYSIGQPINYRFIVKNTGSTSLSSITLADDLTGFLCDQSVGFLSSGDSSIIDCTWSYGFVNSETPYINTATATGTYNSMEFSAQDSAAAMVLPLCELNINTTYSENCQANGNNYTADWKIGIEVVGNFDNDISYQRNSEVIQMHALTGTSDTLTISDIPADGGLYDTLKVWMSNDLACADTIILKRPVPCPMTTTFCAVVPDGGFEAGNFPGNGTATAFAGGTRVNFEDQSPDSWTPATNTNFGENHWVESTAAYSGNKYVYQFSSGTTTGTNDACSQYDVSGLPSGSCIQICVYAADANADGNSSGLAIEIEEYPSNTFHYENVELVDNPTWDDNALTNIPWQQYCYNFTTQANTDSGRIWISASTEAGTATTSYIVVDDMSVCECGGTEIASGEVCSTVGSNAIAGTVFEDWNYDGIMNQSDTVGVQGVQVDLYDDCGNVDQTTYTDTNGNYQFTNLTNGTTYRVEFSLPESVACWAKPTQSGTDNGTTVQFVQSGNCASLGLAKPSDFCSDDPYFVVACYEAGNATYGATGNENKGIIAMPYSSSGPNPTGVIEVAKIHEVGTVWGEGWQPSKNRMFTASLLKRHSGLGPQGIGGVYVMDFNGGINGIVHSFDLQGVAPANGGANIDLGSIDRSSGPDYTLPDSNLGTFDGEGSVDFDAFDKIGKVSFGDIDVQEEADRLWLVNLNQRALISVDVSDTMSYPGAVHQYLLDDFSGLPDCTNGVLRPWGLTFEKGKGYLGCVCTGENSGSAANMTAYVLSFDPNAPTSFTEEISFPLDFERETSFDFDLAHTFAGEWQPWTSTWTGMGFSTQENVDTLEYSFPQPILSDIDFTEDGSMVLGFSDRFGFQTGADQPRPILGDQIGIYGVSAGDLIKVGRVNGAWVLEANENDDATKSSSGTDGPSGTGEFFYDDAFHDTELSPKYNHNETCLGGLGILKGKNEVLAAHFDPIDGDGLYGDLGFIWHSTMTGAKLDTFRIIDNTTFDNPAATKGNGLGDVEFTCDSAPIEIGNYVWIDSDGDGIQDACEQPLEGVIVALCDTMCNEIAYDTTDVDGQYYFNSQTIRADNQPLALNPNDDYLVIFGALNQFNTTESTLFDSLYLTVVNTGFGENADLNDSDGMINNTGSGLGACTIGHPFVWVKTGDAGCVDHSFDVGFIPQQIYCPTITLSAAPAEVCTGDSTELTFNFDSITGNAALYWSTTLLDSATINSAGHGGATFIDSTQTGVVINEVDYIGGESVELWNTSCETVDVSNWSFCYKFGYNDLSAATISSGDLVLSPGEKVAFSDLPNITMNNSPGSLGLYRNNSNFGDPDNMVDYVQWGASGQARESVAVSKGIWTAGDFVGAIAPGNTIQYDGYGDSSDDWGFGAPTFGSSNVNTDTPLTMTFNSGTLSNVTAAPITYYFYAILTDSNCNRNDDCQPVAIDSVVVNPMPDLTTSDTDICGGLSINLDTLVTNVNNTSMVDTAYFMTMQEAIDSSNAIASLVSPSITTEYYVRLSTHSIPSCYDVDSLTVTVNDIIVTTSTNCDDNGTGGNTNDDTFTITVNATNASSGASGQYSVIYNGNTLNGSGTAYGMEVTVSHADFVANGSFSPILTIRDMDDVGCEVMETVSAVATCSDCPPQTCLPIKTTIKRGGGTN